MEFANHEIDFIPDQLKEAMFDQHFDSLFEPTLVSCVFTDAIHERVHPTNECDGSNPWPVPSRDRHDSYAQKGGRVGLDHSRKPTVARWNPCLLDELVPQHQGLQPMFASAGVFVVLGLERDDDLFLYKIANVDAALV